MTEEEFRARMLLAGWTQQKIFPSQWWHPSSGYGYRPFSVLLVNGHICYDLSWERACKEVAAHEQRRSRGNIALSGVDS